MPTIRLYLALLVTVPALALGGTPSSVALLLVLGVLTAALADWIQAGRDLRRVSGRREVEDKLSLGAWNPVRLVIRNQVARPLRIEVRDLVPPEFGVALSAAFEPTGLNRVRAEPGMKTRASSPPPPPPFVLSLSKGAGRTTSSAVPFVVSLSNHERDAGGFHAPVVPRGAGATVEAHTTAWWRGRGWGRASGASAPVGFPTWLPEPVVAGGEGTLLYRVRPGKRGDYPFGDLFLRIGGPLGLVRREKRETGSARTVRVYPNLRDLRKYDLLARRGLLMEAGQRAIRVPGASTEFERLREYVPDDEFRRINWKATARRGTPIVNQLEAERSQNLVIMLDAGRLMAARADDPATDQAEALVEGDTSVGLTKLDHALNAGLLLAYVASLRGDRVALLGYTDVVRAWVPPARGRRAFVGMVQGLYNLSAEPVEPDHGLAFSFLASRNLRRSLVVLFTDLADRESSRSLVARLTHAARHHQVVCVTLADPTVARPARALPTDSQSLYEKMVAQRLLDDRAITLGGLSQQGVVSLDTDADALNPRLVSTYLQLKQRARV